MISLPPSDHPWEGNAFHRNCGEHRTTGQRAWCFDCSEWCYPNLLCPGCHPRNLGEPRMTEPLKYTESDMRVLTEAALRLGRKEAGEEIAAAIENNHGWQTPKQQEALDFAAQIARNVGSRVSADATSGRTDPGDPNG